MIYFKAYFSKRWFQILILLGLFILLWKPAPKVSENIINDPNKGKSNWFSDIKLGFDTKNNTKPMSNTTHMNPSVHISPTPLEPTDTINYKLLDANRQLVLMEAIRREPDLSKWSVLNLERKDFPTIDYIEAVLIEEVGYEYLYEDVDRGVELIMKKISKVKDGRKR